jgi:hypothetical protein
MKITAPVGVFSIAEEPPEAAHTVTQGQGKETVIASPRRSPPLPLGKHSGFIMSLWFCRRRRCAKRFLHHVVCYAQIC